MRWVSLVAACGLLMTGSAVRAEELKAECPRVTESGVRLQADRLARTGSLPLRATTSETSIHDGFRDTVTVYWQPGDPPISDAVFLCRYRDRSEIEHRIAGALLRCRTLAAESGPAAFARTQCVFETEPDRLQER